MHTFLISLLDSITSALNVSSGGVLHEVVTVHLVLAWVAIDSYQTL